MIPCELHVISRLHLILGMPGVHTKSKPTKIWRSRKRFRDCTKPDPRVWDVGVKGYGLHGIQHGERITLKGKPNKRNPGPMVQWSMSLTHSPQPNTQSSKDCKKKRPACRSARRSAGMTSNLNNEISEDTFET